MVAIPQRLQDDEFEMLWTLFLRYSQTDHKAIGEIQQEVLLMKLARWGLGRAVDALEHTMSNGWTCIREPERDNAGHPQRRYRHSAEAREAANADAFAVFRTAGGAAD